MKSPESRRARLGKIARLPCAIRQELNERLADGEPGQRLVQWLNALPAVQECLDDLFAGRPINEPNLTAWKQGGFREWERLQQRRLGVRALLEETRELTSKIHTPGRASSPRARETELLAVGLLQRFREAEISEPGPSRTRAMLKSARQLRQLRQSDHLPLTPTEAHSR